MIFIRTASGFAQCIALGQIRVGKGQRHLQKTVKRDFRELVAHVVLIENRVTFRIGQKFRQRGGTPFAVERNGDTASAYDRKKRNGPAIGIFAADGDFFVFQTHCAQICRKTFDVTCHVGICACGNTVLGKWIAPQIGDVVIIPLFHAVEQITEIADFPCGIFGCFVFHRSFLLHHFDLLFISIP